MAEGFVKIRYRAVDKDERELRSIGTRALAHRGLGRRKRREEELSFSNDEAAARHYLTNVFERDERPGVRGLSAPDSSESVPDFETVDVQSIGLTKTRLVRFEQTHATIPIFGSHLNVQLDRERELVDIVGDVAEELEDLPTIPALSPQDAVRRIEEFTGQEKGALDGVNPPKLNFYRDNEKNAWRLVYFFREIPAAPAEFIETAAAKRSHGHGLNKSARLRRPIMNYLVDAHRGDIVFHFSATPLAIASKCRGVDEEGVEVSFFGTKVGDQQFEMFDPMRLIKTYDLELRDIDQEPIPTQPVRADAADFGKDRTAAISAHANAQIVDKFLRSVLMRTGIDDKGMSLESVVNCTSEADQPPPEWDNAFWWKKRMWYGQQDEAGTLRSYSRLLDVIAHELMHGVTESSAGLIYDKQSGALNESFSDIFAIVISNWSRLGEESEVGNWSWEMGPGLGGDDLPLRDLSNPRRTGDPDHMKDYLVTTADSGGVHTNSNIHNKAAYNVFMATVDGARVFEWRDVAILYYLCLIRLGATATFSDAMGGLVDAATIYFAGEVDLEDKLEAIRVAYEKVGIA